LHLNSKRCETSWPIWNNSINFIKTLFWNKLKFSWIRRTKFPNKNWSFKEHKDLTKTKDYRPFHRISQRVKNRCQDITKHKIILPILWWKKSCKNKLKKSKEGTKMDKSTFSIACQEVWVLNNKSSMEVTLQVLT